MKIAELEKRKTELKDSLKTDTGVSLDVIARLQEINYRLDVSEVISTYYYAAKKCKTAKEFKLIYLAFSKYINTLVMNFFFTPKDEKKGAKIDVATDKFLSVVNSVATKAQNSNFEKYEEFISSFLDDSLNINNEFNKFRDNFIEIK